MPAKKLYKVIEGPDLDYEVTSAIKDGWKPCGGVSWKPSVSGPDVPCQAVWREND